MDEAAPGHADCDVLVVGSGAGGMLAAIRAHDLGLKTLLLEKASVYGGTSALSGGQIWIPGHHLGNADDSRADVESYLRAITAGDIDPAKMAAYLDEGPELAHILDSLGLDLMCVSGFPDYYSEVEGSGVGRAVVPRPFDAADLGADFKTLREAPALWRLFNRYTLDTPELGLFATRAPGWRSALVRIISRYWLDARWRLKTRRDRRADHGRRSDRSPSKSPRRTSGPASS